MKKRMSLQDKAEAALKKAARQVVERHKKTGRSLAVWQNGKTVRISPNTVRQMEMGCQETPQVEHVFFDKML